MSDLMGNDLHDNLSMMNSAWMPETVGDLDGLMMRRSSVEVVVIIVLWTDSHAGPDVNGDGAL